MSEYKNKTKNKKTTGNELDNVSGDVLEKINTVQAVLGHKISKNEILHALKETDYNLDLVIEKYLEGINKWTVVEKIPKKVATKPTNEFKTKNKKPRGEFKKNENGGKTTNGSSKQKKEFEKSTLDETKKNIKETQEESKKAVPAKVKTFVQPQPVEDTPATMSYSQIVSSDQKSKKEEAVEEVQQTQKKKKNKKTSKKNETKQIQEQVQEQSHQPQQKINQQIFEPLEDLNSNSNAFNTSIDEDSVILDVSNGGFDYSDINLQFGTLGISKEEKSSRNNSNHQQSYPNTTWNQNQNFMQESQQTSPQNFQHTNHQNGKKEKMSKYAPNQQQQHQQQQQQQPFLPNQYGQFYAYPNPYVMQQYQNYNKQFYGGKYPNYYNQQQQGGGQQYNTNGQFPNVTSPQGSFGESDFGGKFAQQQQYYQQYYQQQNKQDIDKKDNQEGQPQPQINPYQQYQMPYGNQYSSYMYGQQMYGNPQPFMMNQMQNVKKTETNKQQEEWRKYQ